MAAGDSVVTAVQNVDRLIVELAAGTQARIEDTVRGIGAYGDLLITRAELTVSRNDAAIEVYIFRLTASAEYHILRGYWHASPSLIAILTGIWAAIQFVWKIVNVIAQVINIIQITGIDTLLYNTWDAYREARDRLNSWIGGLSKKLGWGVTAINALLNLPMVTFGAIKGITGKEYGWDKLEWLKNAQSLTLNLQQQLTRIQADPSIIFSIMAEHGAGVMNITGASWLENLTKTIKSGADIANKAVAGVLSVTNELQTFKLALPENVAKLIPQSVWDGIDNLDGYINQNIVPTLDDIEDHLGDLGAAIDDQKKRMSDIAKRLAAPGSMLKGIDDLPADERVAQEKLVDEIAGRELARNVDAGIDARANEFKELDAVMAASYPAAPAPEVMRIDLPDRGKVTGIKVQPGETWFVGDY